MVLFVGWEPSSPFEPAYESADEPGHVENIESLVSGHWYEIPRHVIRYRQTFNVRVTRSNKRLCTTSF